ncbi:hypothetical protein HF324_28615 [Chitinophaga oryzae]|uniref:Uncharacterized protein n=1 Tax=Chitinophaga oryzae TaxID=2725414 RepID=A0AAE6ZKT5_9BACT|nr:hypothetical protein [Chitinophaga oryzae]QJB35076.1 hypothetical protein HF329_28740 [Chitinophaga oryzae]QJB41593.1 hypothetical protein HF324_28615 [Chitinophaga oryzae]
MRYLPLCFLAVVLGICCMIGCSKDMSQVTREELAAQKAAKLASDSVGLPGDTTRHDSIPHPGDTTRPHWPVDSPKIPVDSPRVPVDSPRHPVDTFRHSRPYSARSN